MAGRLEGEIAVVTGSDSGIRHATAVAFAREGADDVAVTIHNDVEGAERTANEVREHGRRAALVPLDQRDPARVGELFRRVTEELGTTTILVNDAGIDSTGRHAGKNRQGTIINVTSVHQEVPRAGAAGYCAAKGGLRNLTRCLSLELAESNITVKNIAPGMVLTPFNQPAIDDPEILKEQVASIPQKRAAEPEEITRVAVFLASREADYIHGTTVYVDGGLIQNMGQGA